MRCNYCGKKEDTKLQHHGYLKTTVNNDLGGSTQMEILPCGDMVKDKEAADDQG